VRIKRQVWTELYHRAIRKQVAGTRVARFASARYETPASRYPGVSFERDSDDGVDEVKNPETDPLRSATDISLDRDMFPRLK